MEKVIEEVSSFLLDLADFDDFVEGTEDLSAQQKEDLGVFIEGLQDKLMEILDRETK